MLPKPCGGVELRVWTVERNATPDEVAERRELRPQELGERHEVAVAPPGSASGTAFFPAGARRASHDAGAFTKFLIAPDFRLCYQPVAFSLR